MNDDKVKCSICDTDWDSDEIRDLNGEPACPDCTLYCESCSTLMASDDSWSADDGNTILCGDCGWTCENCSDRYSENTDSYTVYHYGEQSWCRGCYEDNTFYCDNCSESYSDSMDSYSVQGESYCSDCYSDNCYWCDECDESFRDDDRCECNEEGGDVRERRADGSCRKCGTSSTVHNYSCKPDLVFHGFSSKKLYMGFELETQIRKDGGDRNTFNPYREASKYASDQLEPDNIAILKEDASIGQDGFNGFEIVTQPHTHEHYRNQSAKLWETIEHLRTEYKARAWDTTSCGLHIHISRAGFNGGAHTHRWLTFIYKNAEPLMKLAGRKSRYARFNDVWTFDEYDRPVFSLAHKVATGRDRGNTERYSAVNTQNQHTLELRFFRGTMNKSGVLSALDLAQASVEYTRNLSLSDVKMGALGWDWFVDYVEQNNGLYPDLYSRLPRLASVDINRPVTMEA